MRSSLVALAAVICCALGFTMARPDLWLVEAVVFVGVDRATTVTLRHLADLPNGTRMWQVDTDRIARGVQLHPWVASATVSMAWPATVRVEIEEHSIAGVLHDGGRLLYVDTYGRPFLPADPMELDYPHITGIHRDLDATHPELGSLAVRTALHLVQRLEVRGLLTQDDVSEVHYSASGGFTVHTRGARVLFGHGAHAGQVDRLSQLVDHGLDLTHPTYVDLAPPSVAIVRPLTFPLGG